MRGAGVQLPFAGFEPDLERLAKLSAPERAQLYAAMGLDLGERQQVEVVVRARIAAAYRRELGRRR
jgi:hypothetical protein